MRGIVFAIVVTGCHGSPHARPDAVSGDAPASDVFADIDAIADSVVADAPSDAPDVLIHAQITVELGGLPSVGERILINRQDGSLVGEGVTDASGAFATALPEGGSLTWVRADAPIKDFWTYGGLHDGDLVNTGDPPPSPNGATTPVSITRTSIPNAVYTTFGIGRFPDQTFTGTTFSYPTTATGTVAVIQEGQDMSHYSVGYSTTNVTVAPGAAVTMPSTIHQGLDLVIDVSAPVLQGAIISAGVAPFQDVDALQARQEFADAAGAVSITFPRFIYGELAYTSKLHIYFDAIGLSEESHFTHYIIDSSITHASFGLADLADCPKSVAYNGTAVTIGQPPSHGDFAQYRVGRWLATVPIATTSVTRIQVPLDLASEFGKLTPLNGKTVDSADIDYRTALSLQRSTHYSEYGYTGDGHPFMRECWRSW